MSEFSHLNKQGEAHMVDIGEKVESRRLALATGYIQLSSEAFEAVSEQTVSKGDVLATARIAGIMASKKTAELIPLCHPLPITHIQIDFDLEIASHRIHARCEVGTHYKTGVEMEAISGVQGALATIYDMCKAIDKGMIISDVHVVQKSGGRSGDWHSG